MKRVILTSLILVILLSACQKTTPTNAPLPSDTPVVESPTPTSAPMALIVNGEGILLSDYQAALDRLKMAENELDRVTSPEEQKNRVVQNFVDEALLMQAATQNGFSVDEATLQARIDKLAADVGGSEKLSAWQSVNQYTAESFKNALRREIMAAWQRDQIINAVPTSTDQIHARQILFQDEANALAAYQKLQDGENFTDLAFKYDPSLGGDLGWFAAGTLTQPEVDSAVFALQPGAYTQVIQSALGYHILFVIEREAQHPLSVDGRRLLQEAALQKWLQDARSASVIQILV